MAHRRSELAAARTASSLPATTTLSAHLNGRVDELRRMVPRALRSWDPVAIHQARVTTRRLKAAIDLLELVLPPARRKRFAKTLRRLRKALGPLRDTDVMLGHLDELRARPAQPAAIEWLTKVLQQRRTELRRECTREHPPTSVLDGLGTWWSLEHEVAEAEHATESLLRRAAPQQWKAFADRADRLVAEREQHRRTESTQAAEVGTDDDVHSLRIAGKLLRYTLELAEPAGYAMPGDVLRSFKKLQEALGAWHDYVVLGENAIRAALKAELPAHHGRLYGEVLELSRGLWKQSERHLDRFVTLWRSRCEPIARRIAETFQPTSACPTTPPRSQPAAPTLRPDDTADVAATQLTPVESAVTS